METALHIREVFERTAKFYGLSYEELTGPRKPRRFAVPRMMAMTLARRFVRDSRNKNKPASTTLVGRRCGGRDHTTVIHATQRIAQLENKLPTVRDHMSRLTDRVLSRGGLLTERPSYSRELIGVSLTDDAQFFGGFGWHDVFPGVPAHDCSQSTAEIGSNLMPPVRAVESEA